MTKVVGILPAGGNATRFDGVYKELLPISGRGETALSRSVQAMIKGGASEIYLATNSDKLAMHMKAVKHISEIRFQPATYDGLWEVIMDAARHEADRYLFAMPDTVYPKDVFENMSDVDVAVGTFLTHSPQRFGVFWENEILDKHDMPNNTAYTAWGVWSWSKKAMERLAEDMYRTRDHTAGLNMLLRKYAKTERLMDYYYDFASFEDYKEFLCNPTLNL